MNEIYNCPHCFQELKRFAFHCPRCGTLVGMVFVEGDMLAKWWVDASGAPLKKRGVKMLKHGQDYLNVKEVSAHYPSEKSSRDITITTSDGKTFKQTLVEFFAQAVKDDSKEWIVK